MSDVLATVWAGTVHTVHGHLEFITLQLFGTTAEREYLIIIAAPYGITPNPATFASGTTTVVAVGPENIPAGTVLVRDDGAQYEVTTLTVITGSGPVPVEALLAGADGNMPLNDTLDFETPIPGVDSETTVVLISDGLDEEDTEDFRSRYLQRRRNPPKGGNDADYIGWAREVPGVTRAWVARHEDGLGTVKVRFVLDDLASIFPTAPKIVEVQAKLDSERPTTAEVTADGPSDLPVLFTIALANDTAAIRTAVENELADLVFREGEPGNGVDLGVILLSAIRTAIGNVADGDYTLTVPAADVVPATGELPTFDATDITWL